MQPVLVHVGPTGHLRPRPGIDVDRSRLPDDDVVIVRGVAVTVAARAVQDVIRRVEASRGARGIPRARRVAPLLSARVRSVPESRFRYVWVVEAGLPVPLVNAPVVDVRDGMAVGEVDLLDDVAGVAGEYDGAHHRELGQHTADNVREEGLEELGLLVVRATSIDLWPRRSLLVRRLVRRHAQGLLRDRSRDRWGLGAARPI